MAKAQKKDKKQKTPAPVAIGPAGLLQVQARYDAAGQGRRMSGWNAPSSGPNRAAAGLHAIRNRSRDANRNEWAGASSERVMTTNLIGTGIVARPRTKDRSTKTKLVEWWDSWCEVADADGVLDFAGLQALGVGTWCVSGECFARLRTRRIEDGLPAPLQVQLIEPDLVPPFDSDYWPGMKTGNRIRQGIELDVIGRRSAYWMYREHPGDVISTAVSMADLVRVPAESVLHIYRPKRPGQLRGVPESAPILAKMRAVMDFDDSTVERQRLANLFLGFFKRPMPHPGDTNIDPLTGMAMSYDGQGAPITGMQPGVMQELMPGEEVQFSTPPDAGANYADFMRQQHLGIAAGPGVPYELMTGDIKDVSDRALRIVINEFRRYCEQLQWTILIPQLCKPVRAAAARASYVAGLLTNQEWTEATRTDWQPQGWAYIHPVQDVQAKKIEVDEGFKSRSQIISTNGDDPESIDESRAEDQQREKRFGIETKPPAALKNQTNPNG